MREIGEPVLKSVLRYICVANIQGKLTRTMEGEFQPACPHGVEVERREKAWRGMKNRPPMSAHVAQFDTGVPVFGTFPLIVSVKCLNPKVEYPRKDLYRKNAIDTSSSGVQMTFVKSNSPAMFGHCFFQFVND